MSYQLARQAVYALKRQFPLPLDLYFPDAPSIDTRTGVMSVAATKVHVRRAILMPDKAQREGRYDRSFVREATDFVFGGFYDFNTRKVLVDLSDIKPRLPDINCWVVINHARYEVKEIEFFEQARAVQMTIVRLHGAKTFEQIEAKVKDSTTFTGGATNA